MGEGLVVETAAHHMPAFRGQDPDGRHAGVGRSDAKARGQFVGTIRLGLLRRDFRERAHHRGNIVSSERAEARAGFLEIDLHRRQIKVVVEDEDAIGITGGHAVVGDDHEVRRDSCRVQTGGEGANAGVEEFDRGDELRRIRTMAVPGGIGFFEVERDDGGALRGGQAEPGNEFIEALLEGSAGVVVGFPIRRAQATDLGFGAGPE